MQNSRGPRTQFADYLHAMKYRGANENFEEYAYRVAYGLSDNGKHYHALNDILIDQRFMPGGRVQGAIGAQRKTTPYNCFVAPTIDDAYVGDLDGKLTDNSIMGVAHQAAATMRMGGGIGYDFSTLRPRGDLIRQLQSSSSGPVSFMSIFNEVCLCTSSSGHRRGAQMGVLRIDHPDVEEFIRVKQREGVLTGFNISVAVTDEFMNALERRSTFELKFAGKVYREVDAQELWEKIMRATWDYADPGVIFIDTINRMNNLWYCETIAATNPCFTGDTKVWTDRGHIQFKDLVGKTVNVLSQSWDGKLVYRPMSNIRITKRRAKLVEVTFDDGQKVRCTPDHMFFLKSGGQIEAGRLQEGMSISSVYRFKANQKGYFRLTNGAHQPLEHHVHFEDGIPEGYEVHHKDEVKSHNWESNLELLAGADHRRLHMVGEANPMRRFPEKNHFLYEDFSGESNGRWRPELDTQEMISDRETGMSYKQIADKHGCCKYTVRKRILEANHRVASVKELTIMEDVYCGSVDEFNRFFVALGADDGILVHNCGEQPLPPNGACLLGSFNLTKYLIPRPPLDDQVTYDFDFAQLIADIPVVVRAMDNVVDRALYPLEAQEKEAKNKRRMGLGVTGLANAAEACGYIYGSPAFLAFEAQVLSVIQDWCYMSSAELAAEKGSFPLYDADKYLAGQFVRNLPPGVISLIRQHGIRNSHLTSIAPTGTISMCADNVSSGLEPVFSYSTTRPINTPDGPVISTIHDYGYSMLNVRGKLTAQVTAKEHVDVLVTAQKYIDSAVSKTCNVTGNMPWEAFKDIYIQTYKGGGKGCTTFNSDGKKMALLTASKEPDGQVCEIINGVRSCE